MQPEYQKQKRIWTSLGFVFALFSVAYFGIVFQTQIITYLVTILLVTFSFLLIRTIRKEGGFVTILVIMGCMTIILGAQVPTNFPITEESLDPTAFWWNPASEKVEHLTEAREWGKHLSLFTGIFCIGLGLALAYKPNLVYVKNRLPFQYPYPVWESKKQPVSKFSRTLIPLRSLLSESEKHVISKYKFVLVAINNKPYLVSIHERVPEDTRILRTKSGNSLRGL